MERGSLYTLLSCRSLQCLEHGYWRPTVHDFVICLLVLFSPFSFLYAFMYVLSQLFEPLTKSDATYVDRGCALCLLCCSWSHDGIFEAYIVLLNDQTTEHVNISSIQFCSLSKNSPLQCINPVSHVADRTGTECTVTDYL